MGISRNWAISHVISWSPKYSGMEKLIKNGQICCYQYFARENLPCNSNLINSTNPPI